MSLVKAKHSRSNLNGGIGTMRGRGAALALVLAVLAALAAPSSAAAKAPMCHELAFSPDFTRDRTMFCLASAGRTIALHESRDAGRSWGPPRLVTVDGGSPGIVISPLFPQDHRVYVSTISKATYSFFESTDAGRTFRIVPDSDGREILASWLAPYVETLSTNPEGEPRVAFGILHPATYRGMGVYDSKLGFRSAVGSPYSTRLIIPPDYAKTRQAVMIGAELGVYHADKPINEPGFGAYLCVGDFVCNHRIAYFGNIGGSGIGAIGPRGQEYLIGQDSRRFYVTPEPKIRLNYAYRTRDYGHTWSRWTSVEKLLNNRSTVPDGYRLTITASPDAPRRLFLQLVGDPDATHATAPVIQLYRSDNDGATWRRIGHAWGPKQKTKAKSSLPWNTDSPSRRQIIAMPGGRLYLTASHMTGSKTDFVGMYCSVDLGRNWRAGRC